MLYARPQDHLCEDLGLGPECCLDVEAGVRQLEAGQPEAAWSKRCCDNLRAPVTRPHNNLTKDIVRQVTSG